MSYYSDDARRDVGFDIGIWSPDAAVRCTRCNNAMVGKAHWARRIDARNVTPDCEEDIIAKCDDCGREVVVDRATGRLHALKRVFPDGAMEQTGGMCQAFVLRRDGVCVLITEDENSHREAYVVGTFVGGDSEEYGESFDTDDGIAWEEIPRTVDRMIIAATR